MAALELLMNARKSMTFIMIVWGGLALCSYTVMTNIVITHRVVVEIAGHRQQELRQPRPQPHQIESFKHAANEALTIVSKPTGPSKLGLARDPTDPLPHGGRTVNLPAFALRNRLMVVPEYKLLFCYVEKVGCSMFNQLFRLLRLYHPQQSPEERAYLAESHFGRANPNHFNLTHYDLTKMVNDDTWTKAVFFRDPADRFLSGFKSKCGGADYDGGRHCREAFGEVINKKGQKRPILDGSVASFHQSIEIAKNSTRRVFNNPHFKPAAGFCGGLGSSIDHYAFVHALDKKTVSGHVKTLFDHLGVDETLTAELIDRVVKTGGMLHPIDFERVQQQYGLRMRGNISNSHNTGNSRLSTKDYFQSERWLKKLVKIYQSDYDMFQLEPPRFEDLH